MKGIKVMLVDDEEQFVHTLAERMSMRDAGTKVALNGEEALQLVANGEVPDVMVLDLRMPGIDGFEMIRRLRADPQLQELDIVVVSGLADDEILENGGLPADVILYSKPVPFRELKGYVQAKIMAMQRRGRAL